MRKGLPLRPMNRIIARHVNIIRIRLDHKCIFLGDIRKMIGFTRSHFVHFSIIGSRLHSLIRPNSRIQIATAVFEEIGAMHEELHTAAALHKDDVIVIGNLHEPA